MSTAARSACELIMQVRPPHTMPPGLSPEQFQPAMVSQWVTLCAELGVTAIFWMVQYVGKATYHSRVLPRMAPLEPGYFERRGVPPGSAWDLFNRIGAALARFDTLEVALAEAKRHGIALYADLGLFDQYFPGLESTFFDQSPQLWLRGRHRRRPTQMYDQVMPEPYRRLAVEADPHRPGQTWFRGLPCYAEPEAQEHWLGVVGELLERGVEGFTFSFGSHVRGGFGNTWRVLDGDEGPDSFGFNGPVVAEYRRRHGTDLLTERFEPDALHRLHGEFFTAFLGRVRQAIGPTRRLVAATTLDGQCGYGVDGAQFRMGLDWRSWIEGGIADDLMVYESPPGSVEQIRREIKEKLGKGRVFVWRDLRAKGPDDFPRVRAELDQVRAGALDGFGVKELAPFYHPHTRSAWQAFFEGPRAGGARAAEMAETATVQDWQTRARASRQRLAADPWRPRYHYLAPANLLKDPNGPLCWRGRYHLFYQCNPNSVDDTAMTWGHAVSADLLHWTDLPPALVPGPDGPDRGGCWSGQTILHEGRPAIVYFGHPGGVCLATSDDDELLHWRKLEVNPILAQAGPAEPWRAFDPCAWREGDRWLLACGGRDGHGDTAYLFQSPDMEHWRYLHPLYRGGPPWTDAGEDCAVPDFLALGGEHMLLFASHRRGSQHYLGAWDGAAARFTPRRHGRMTCNWRPAAARRWREP